MPVTAQEAGNQLRDLNRKVIAQIPENIKRLAAAAPVYLFNVGPHRWLREMGSLGPYTIFPCEPGQEYSKPTVIPAVIFEAIPVDMKTMEHRQWEGKEVAKDILGIGPFKKESEALTHWGVFMSDSNPPKKEEVEAARALLMGMYNRLVNEADAFYHEGPNEYRNITGLHRTALQATNQHRPWAQLSTQMEKCPACQEPMQPGVVKHSCGAILDWNRARQMHLVTKEEFDAAVRDGLVAGEKPVSKKS